jgi:hypothetical protein
MGLVGDEVWVRADGDERVIVADSHAKRAQGAIRHASQWVARLVEAHAAGRLQAELVRLGRYPLLVVDEVGCIPFEAERRTCSSSSSPPATNGRR